MLHTFNSKRIFWQKMLEIWQNPVSETKSTKTLLLNVSCIFCVNLTQNSCFGKRCLKFYKTQSPKQNKVKRLFRLFILCADLKQKAHVLTRNALDFAKASLKHKKRAKRTFEEPIVFCASRSTKFPNDVL